MLSIRTQLEWHFYHEATLYYRYKDYLSRLRLEGSIMGSQAEKEDLLEEILPGLIGEYGGPIDIRVRLCGGRLRYSLMVGFGNRMCCVAGSTSDSIEECLDRSFRRWVNRSEEEPFI